MTDAKQNGDSIVKPSPPCNIFWSEDDEVFGGFICHVGTNAPEHIAWRMGLRPEEERNG